MMTDTLLEQAEACVRVLFQSYNRTYLLYHNLQHTQQVVMHCREMADYYKLSNRSNFILRVAAWFHDTGQLTGDMAVHEERGIQFMKDFFETKSVDQHLKDDIANCIMATKMPVSPSNELEKILCDADTYHLGTKDFKMLDDLVWQELELRLNKPVEHKTEKSLQFLLEHQFYTSYCQQKLTAGKNKNIAALKSILGKSSK